MKKGIGWPGAALVLILVLLAFVCSPSVARAQAACGTLGGNCAGGTCPDLYDAAGNVAGTPTCQQPKGEKCACVLTKADAACTINQQNQKCQETKGTKCPVYYRSADDARNGKNPVRGVCMHVAGGNPSCQCVWKFR